MSKNKRRNKLVLEGSKKALEYLQALFKSGELSEWLGVEVLDVGAVSESQLEEALTDVGVVSESQLSEASDERIREERAENLEAEIKYYSSALEVRTRERFPVDWATTQNNLGAIYRERIRGDRAENIEIAIRCYQAALQVYTREAFPEQWAETQTNLGNAYEQRLRGDRAENLEAAIRCYSLALEVRTRDEAFPQDRVMTQNNQGGADDTWVHLSSWFQRNTRNILEGWEYVAVLKGTLWAAQQNSPAFTRSASDTTSTSPTTRGNETNDENQNNSFEVALELGQDSNASPEVITTLVDSLESCEHEEIFWQLALSLGKLAPDCPQAAIAQRKEMELGDLLLELLVAIKQSEEGNVDILLQLYSMEEQYLPPELELTVFDESGEVSTKTIAQEEDSYICLGFLRSLGERFTVRISVEDDSIEEYFLA